MAETSNVSDRSVLTVPEAAVVLSISRSLAYQLIVRGELPALRLGRRVIVPARALDALLETALPHGEL